MNAKNISLSINFNSIRIKIIRVLSLDIFIKVPDYSHVFFFISGQVNYFTKAGQFIFIIKVSKQDGNIGS